jgi:hypothetical protein
MGKTQEDVQGLLQNLRNLDGLKELFRSQLSYDLRKAIDLSLTREVGHDPSAERD